MTKPKLMKTKPKTECLVDMASGPSESVKTVWKLVDTSPEIQSGKWSEAMPGCHVNWLLYGDVSCSRSVYLRQGTYHTHVISSTEDHADMFRSELQTKHTSLPLAKAASTRFAKRCIRIIADGARNV